MSKENALRLRAIGFVIFLIGVIAACVFVGWFAYLTSVPNTPEGYPDISPLLENIDWISGFVIAPLGILQGLLFIVIASIDIAAYKKGAVQLQAGENGSEPKTAYNFWRVVQSMAIGGVVGLLFSYLSVFLLTDRSRAGMGIGWAVYLIIEWAIAIFTSMLGGVIEVGRKNDLSANIKGAFLWAMSASTGFLLLWGLAFYRP
jgi:hypothetical protein